MRWRMNREQKERLMEKIEKKFFETFRVNKSTLCKYAIDGYESEEGNWYKCSKRDKECFTYSNEVSTVCKDRETDYPQITDKRLLKLICLALPCGEYARTTTVKNIKDRTLRILLEHHKLLKEHDIEDDLIVKRINAVFKDNE